MKSPYRAHLLTAISTLSVFAAAPAAAQDGSLPDDDGASQDDNEIVVIADRLRGAVDAPQPPILVLDETDIAAYGAGSIADLLDQLAPQTGSGSGRGSGRPVILVNGTRIASFRELRSYPPEAIQRVEVLPEEVALRYGYSADKRVVNIILKDRFTSREVELEYKQPDKGGYSEKQAELTYLRITGPRRLNLNVELNDSSMLTEAERGVIQADGSQPDLATDPDPARYRSLVPDSDDLEATANWTTRLGDSGSSLSVNGTVERTNNLAYSGLDTVELTDPEGNSLLRSYGEDTPLRRRTQTTTYSLGSALNAPMGDWQFTATLDASRADSETKIDRRADSSALVAAAAAGTLPIDGDLPSSVDAGYDLAQSTSDSLSSLATMMGNPILLPAGEVSATFDTGFNWTRIQSTDTRNPGLETELTRGDLSAGVNVGIPIASRREDAWAWLGDFSVNLSAGVDRLSDFGTLTNWSAGAVWGLTEKLSLQGTFIGKDAAPELAQLGNPDVQTLNVPVYDFSRGETVLVTTTSGGNPDLGREKQRDFHASLLWDLPFLDRSNFQLEYFRNRSENVAASFPLLTPAIEAAFPDRVTRDTNGQLVAIDQRPVTFARQNSSRLKFGLNISGSLGKATPEDETASASPAPGGRGGWRGRGSATADGEQSNRGQDGTGRFAEFREHLCAEGETPDISTLPDDMQSRLRDADGKVDQEKLARLKSRVCSADGAQGPGGMFDPRRFAEFRQHLCAEGDKPDLSGLPEEMLARLRGENGEIDPAKLARLKDRVCNGPAPGAAPEGGPPPERESRRGGQDGPGAGGPPPGGPGGHGGRGMGRFGGGGDGRGRWFANLSYTLELENEVLIAEGLPVLDLLDGDALSGGGVSRHSVELEGGLFYRGFGLRLSGEYSGPSRVDGSGLPGSSDLHFGGLGTVDLRLFADLGQQKSLVNKAPFFKGTRISLRVDNLFDSRRRVTDENGDVPLSYQPALIDPVGRKIGIEFRKLF